jgi:hypothetical protein
MTGGYPSTVTLNRREVSGGAGFVDFSIRAPTSNILSTASPPSPIACTTPATAHPLQPTSWIHSYNAGTDICLQEPAAIPRRDPRVGPSYIWYTTTSASTGPVFAWSQTALQVFRCSENSQQQLRRKDSNSSVTFARHGQRSIERGQH